MSSLGRHQSGLHPRHVGDEAANGPINNGIRLADNRPFPAFIPEKVHGLGKTGLVGRTIPSSRTHT
jgi:hypothetical protein